MLCSSNRLIFLLILLWNALVVCRDKVDYVPSVFYDRVVGPNKTLRIPEEELEFYLPVDWPNPTLIGDSKKCKPGEYCAYTLTHGLEYYCYNLPQFPAFEIRKRVSMVNTLNRIFGCNTSTYCDDFMKPSSCDMNITVKIGEYTGWCMKVEPFSYMLSANVDNLPKDATVEDKLPFLPENYEVGVKENFTDCALARCNDGQFCDYIHRYPHEERTDYGRCFKVPTFPDSNEGPRIPIVVSKSKYLLPCSKNEDCYCSECEPDEILRCDKTTGWTFKNSSTREKHNGICVKAHPVGFTFAETYTHLNSDVVYEERRKYFPTDFTGLGQKVMKKCSSNKDCADGQFCDGVFDSASNSVKSGRSYCYNIPVPIDPVFRETTKAVISPDVSGLKLCNVASNCPLDSFCNSLTGEKFVEWNETSYMKDVYNGFCVRAGNCTVNEFNEAFKWEFGTSPSDEQVSCDSDVDCARTRDTSDTTYQGYCSLKNVLQNVNLCCHREVSPCKYGKIVEAGKRCQNNVSAALFSQGGFAECNGGLEKMNEQSEKSDKWCDDGNHQCCQSPTNDKVQYCPDGQTPLFNEPKCQNYDENVPNSGECVGRPGTICKHGYCCSGAKLDANGKLIRSKYPYITNYPCQRGIRPPQFSGGYCEPESQNVVIYGELTFLNETMTRWDDDGPKKCEKDSDCSTDNSTLCIYNDDTTAYCYYNLRNHLPPQSNSYVIIIIVSITFAVLLIVVGTVAVIWVLKKKQIILRKPKGSEEAGVESPQTPSKISELKVATDTVTIPTRK